MIPRAWSKSISRQRLLAVGLLLLVILLLSAILFVPLISETMALSEQQASLLFKLQQYQRTLAQKDAVLANLDTLKNQHDDQGYFNHQTTDALASADMQNFIKKTIVDAGGQLSSTQAIQLSNEDDFNRITVRVRMTGSSDVLRTVLYKIESATPLIIIDQIDIRPMRGRRNMTTQKIEPSNELNVNFQAVSFMRKNANES
jgi:general secretion pathway protein M